MLYLQLKLYSLVFCHRNKFTFELRYKITEMDQLHIDAHLAGLNLGKIKHVDVVTGTRSGKAEKWKGQEVPPNLDYEMWVGPGPMTPYHVDRVHYNFRFVSESMPDGVTDTYDMTFIMPLNEEQP